MECSGFISFESCGYIFFFLFFSSCFPGTIRGLYLLSATYLNKLNVSMVPSDRIAHSKGSIRVGASLHEDGNRVGFRNFVFFYFRRWANSKRKGDCVSESCTIVKAIKC